MLDFFSLLTGPPDERLLEDDECRAKSPGDVAKFDGKIVYNPDGSAYIIEDCDLLDDEDSLQLPKQEGSIVELPGERIRSIYASSSKIPCF